MSSKKTKAGTRSKAGSGKNPSVALSTSSSAKGGKKRALEQETKPPHNSALPHKAASNSASTSNANKSNSKQTSSTTESSDLPSAGYLISCDIPTKQFIQYLDELKPVDKKFILQELDSTHLLVKLSCRNEIEKKVDDWLNENVFSAIEKVGEDLDVS